MRSSSETVQRATQTCPPAPLRVGDRLFRFDRLDRPVLMGIVNVTPDSFSDGGRFLEPGAAIEQALCEVEAGADLIDVGGESSRPGAQGVSAALELDRVLPVIEGVVRFSAAPISVDTVKADVARACLDAGASMINDISAGQDPDMLPLAAARGVPICLMHMRGEPRTMQQGPIEYSDLLGEIAAFLEAATRRAVQAGVARERVLWDPGIGFGKTPIHNLEILHRLPLFLGHAQPVLVGPSRKSFIGKVLGPAYGAERRLFGTAAAVAAAVLAGAHVVRVHDVAEMREVALVAHAIRTERLLGGSE